jgi:L-fuconolactonase
MRIDAHQHFWLPARNDYAWMQSLTGEAARRLRRPALPAELEPILAHHGITRTVLVQAAETEAEGDFLLSMAEQHSFVGGVVIWLDMTRPDFERRLSAFSSRPKLVGVRPMIQDIEDPTWMLGPAVKRAFGVLDERGICFDFLIRPHQLEPTLRILDEFPRLRAVIDHIAKPPIASDRRSPWDNLMQRVSEHPNVYCKLSGMITEADHERWIPAQLFPFIKHVVTCFGPERLMFGSDWPVCTLAGSYDQVVAALEESLDALDLRAEARERIFGGTAREFYRLEDADGTREP